MSKEGITRREFVRDYLVSVTAAALLPPFLSGCGKIETSIIEKPQSVEQKREPTFGDVIKVDGEGAFLLKGNGKRYPLLEGELEKYKKASKLTEYKRGVFNVSPVFAKTYPLGTRSELPVIINPYTGLVMVNQTGEVPMYWAGVNSSDSLDLSGIPKMKPITTFPKVTAALEKRGWKDPYNSLFLYGKEALVDFNVEEVTKGGGRGYDAFDTLRPLSELFQDGIEHLQKIQELLPYCQTNHTCHSLGGVIATRAVIEDPSSTNCLFLVASPVRGVEGKLVELFYSALNKLKEFIDVDEAIAKSMLRVIEDLAALRYDKDYQTKLDEFSTSFVRSGKNLTIVIDESDPWVSLDSAMLKEARVIKLKAKAGIELLPSLPSLIGSMMGLPIEFVNFIGAHGRPLSDQQVIKEITNTFGDNRSFPIGKWS